MNGGYELFRIGGVSVRLQGSLLVIGILLAVLAIGAGGSGADVAAHLLNPVLLVVTVLLHEIGHALTARRLGVTVLDIVLGPFGGMARLLGELREPRVEALIALAGPATNLVLAAITLPLIYALGQDDKLVWREIVFFLDDESFMLEGPLLVFFGLNVLLGVVNLIPAFPSDGGRILRALLALKLGRLRATRIAARIGVWTALLLFATPLLSTGPERWILPVIGVFLMIACFKERITVEAREGLGLRIFGPGSASPFGPGGASVFGPAGADPFARPAAEEPEGPTRPVDGEGVIDVSGSSRLVEDEDDDADR